MKKLLSMLLCAMMAFSLAACGSKSTADDTYVYSSELDVKNLDSADSDDGMSFTAMHACIDGLYGSDEKGVTSMALAADEKVSADGLTRTYTLKDGLKWSNGDAVTASDFVYAAKRIFINAGNYSYLYGSDGAHLVGADELMEKMGDENFKGFADADLDTLGIKAVDDKTVEYKLTLPVSYFNEFLAFPCFYPINEKFAEEKGDKYAKSADTVLSNGAFVMKEWQVGKKVTYEKNEDYWNAANVKMNKLVLNLVVAPETASASFKKGETDFALINTSLVDAWKDKAEFKQISEGYLFYISVNTNKDFLANKNIRNAIACAVDREDLCNNTLKDGSKSAAGFVPTGLASNSEGKDFRGDNGEFTTYDLNKAQEYFDAGLKELGKSELTVNILYGTDESPMDIFATYLQNALTQIKGLNVEMTATTKQDRIYNKQKNRDYDICCTRWGPDYADPTTYLTLAQTGNSNNYGDYSSAAYDASLKVVNTTTDMAKRWNAMKECEKILMDDMSFIPVFEKGSASLQNTKVKGLVQKAVGVPYTFNYVSK